VARLGTTAASTSTAPRSAGQSGVRFASCMRAHGLSGFPDPPPAVALDIPKGVKQEPQFQPAFQACRKDLSGFDHPAKHMNLPEELAFSRCIRVHGITDFPDPMPGGGWNLPADSDSPEFEAAARACQSTGVHWNAAP